MRWVTTEYVGEGVSGDELNEGCAYDLNYSPFVMIWWWWMFSSLCLSGLAVCVVQVAGQDDQ